jgi:hypothetical protein
MDGAVNDEARLVNEHLAAVHDVSVEIDADEIRCGDFLETQSELVNQELLPDPRDPGRDMCVDEISPMKLLGESVAGCEVDAHLPLGVAAVSRRACLHDVGCRCHQTHFPSMSLTFGPVSARRRPLLFDADIGVLDHPIPLCGLAAHIICKFRRRAL